MISIPIKTLCLKLVKKKSKPITEKLLSWKKITEDKAEVRTH